MAANGSRNTLNISAETDKSRAVQTLHGSAFLLLHTLQRCVDEIGKLLQTLPELDDGIDVAVRNDTDGSRKAVDTGFQCAAQGCVDTVGGDLHMDIHGDGVIEEQGLQRQAHHKDSRILPLRRELIVDVALFGIIGWTTHWRLRVRV